MMTMRQCHFDSSAVVNCMNDENFISRLCVTTTLVRRQGRVTLPSRPRAPSTGQVHQGQREHRL